MSRNDIPDPGDFADRFSEHVDAWAKQVPSLMLGVQGALRTNQHESATKSLTAICELTRVILDKQVQFNAMVVAAIDRLKAQ